MSSMAYGPLGLKPDEFGRLTFDEFGQLIDGYNWRMKQQEVSQARFVAEIINTCTNRKLKKAVTVEMLLGYDPDDKPVKDAEQRKADMTKLLSEVG